MSSLLAVFFALMVVLPVIYLIVSNDVVRSAFAFVMVMLGLAAIYVLLNAELMAVVQILIYAGGVIVLMIFGIMLTKRGKEEGVFSEHRNILMASLVTLVSFGLLVKWIISAELLFTSYTGQGINQVNQVGVLFLTDHIVAFEVVAVLLLVTLVGAAFLAKKSSQP